MRSAIVTMFLMIGLVLVGGSFAPSIAAAQPEPAAAEAAVKSPARSATALGKGVSARDTWTGEDPTKPSTKTAPGMAIAFWLFAAMAVAGSLFVISRRNLIAAVMGMVGTFFAIAALYMLLYAHFLAVIQMLVYAGAIMVLFVFVIMILNKPEDEPYAGTGKIGKVVAGVAMAYLIARVASVLIGAGDRATAAQLAAPPPTAEGFDWGSTAAVGWNLFTDYIFPFEAVSILLLMAVVGAIAIARPLKDDEAEAEGLEPSVHPSPGHHREVRGGEAL